MVVNKSAAAQAAHITLASFLPAAKVSVFTFSGANATAVVHAADVWMRPKGITMSFPASSITLLVVPKKS
jgi:hypothetical protein